MTEPTLDPRDEEFVRRLHEEQSEADDFHQAIDDHAANLEIMDEPDTTPENT